MADGGWWVMDVDVEVDDDDVDNDADGLLGR